MEHDYRPQDEYFEWDDIMAYKGPSGVHDDLKHSSNPAYQGTIGRSFSFDDSDFDGDDFAWSEASSLSTTPSSLSSTESLSLNFMKETKTDAEIDFPSYNDATSCQSCVTISIDAAVALATPPSPILDPVSEVMASGALPDLEDSQPLSRTVSRGEIHVGARDDFDLDIQPFRNINYLTHDWCEEDIPGTWRYVVSRRSDWTEAATRRRSIWKPFNNIPRYENALWRSWAQRRFQLKTVSPDVINWMKSCDETTLYGPFMMTANEFTPPTTVLADCSRTPTRKPLHKPLLKRPKMSEILLRGSIPTFLSTRPTSNNEIHQTAFQAKPSYDPSVACPGMSVDQRRELTSNARAKLGLVHTNKKVCFLPEVEQWEIIKVRVSAKGRRTLKKLPSTTLDKKPLCFPPPTRINTSIAPAPKKGATVDHWSPDSLWSYNSGDSADQESSVGSSGGWMGVDDEDCVPAPIKIEKKLFPAAVHMPDPPRSRHHQSHSHSHTSSYTHTRKQAMDIGTGSLKNHLGSLRFEDVEEVEDELDYLIAIGAQRAALPKGSLSPPISISSVEDSSVETSDEDEQYPFFGTGDIGEEKRVGLGGMGGIGGLGGRGIRIVGEDDRDILEEYDIVLGS